MPRNRVTLCDSDRSNDDDVVERTQSTQWILSLSLSLFLSFLFSRSHVRTRKNCQNQYICTTRSAVFLAFFSLLFLSMYFIFFGWMTCSTLLLRESNHSQSDYSLLLRMKCKTEKQIVRSLIRIKTATGASLLLPCFAHANIPHCSLTVYCRKEEAHRKTSIRIWTLSSLTYGNHAAIFVLYEGFVDPLFVFFFKLFSLPESIMIEWNLRFRTAYPCYYRY